MKLSVIAAALAALASAQTAAAADFPRTPRDREFHLGAGLTDRQANAIAAVVRASGYSCNSITQGVVTLREKDGNRPA